MHVRSILEQRTFHRYWKMLRTQIKAELSVAATEQTNLISMQLDADWLFDQQSIPVSSSQCWHLAAYGLLRQQKVITILHQRSQSRTCFKQNVIEKFQFYHTKYNSVNENVFTICLAQVSRASGCNLSTEGSLCSNPAKFFSFFR